MLKLEFREITLVGLMNLVLDVNYSYMQVFPLLMEKFSVEEQASLVWQFLCSIPVNMMKKFLPWLSFSISPEEYQEMRNCLCRIIPKEKLLQQVASSFSTYMVLVVFS